MFPSRSVAIGFNCKTSPVFKFKSCPSIDISEILPTLTFNINSSDMLVFPLAGPLYSARTVQFPTSVPSNVAWLPFPDIQAFACGARVDQFPSTSRRLPRISAIDIVKSTDSSEVRMVLSTFTTKSIPIPRLTLTSQDEVNPPVVTEIV